ncbi:hypothetical protein E2P81_ATG08190 [Venturia nashicola]|nr:hypothetical protein E2P81_ATG08190 [Venturia nashicola]
MSSNTAATAPAAPATAPATAPTASTAPTAAMAQISIATMVAWISSPANSSNPPRLWEQPVITGPRRPVRQRGTASCCTNM